MEIDYDNLRTGTAIGFRASHELCSNYLFQLASLAEIICTSSSTSEFVSPLLCSVIAMRLKIDIGVSRKQISHRKRFILSWKVRKKLRENEFCKVV